MKKTTVYIDEKDLGILKTEAFISNTTLASLIRKSIRNFCNQLTVERNIISQLNDVREKNEKYSLEEITDLVNEARKEVRSENKK